MQTANETGIPVTKEAAAGAAVYSKLVLTFYDIEVLMFEIPLIFRCPLKKMISFFNENISDNHLDLGVGTGFFLDKCKFPVDKPMIHLMDLNLNSLKRTTKRIARYKPVAHHWNILEPIKENLPVFNSISAYNFLHCLPGTMLEKEIVFKNLINNLCDGGVFFGITVLGQGININPLCKIANLAYNKLSIFCNLNDNLASLESILAKNFREYSVELVGSIAFFKGIK